MPPTRIAFYRICWFVILTSCMVSCFLTPVNSAPIEEHITQEVYQNLRNKFLLQNLMSSGETPLRLSETEMEDITDQNVNRIKRIGIAGLENLDLLTTSLDKNRNRGNRLSVNLSMPRLAAMLRKLSPS